jgi:A/G-specific adenine glycosylase
VGDAPGDLNQALMELGATVCRPHDPACHRCVLRAACWAFETDRVKDFPTARQAAVRKKLSVAFAWIETPEGVWLEQRPLDGLWAGLWELPSGEGRAAKKGLQEKLAVVLGRPMARVSHQLSHRDVTATVYGLEGVPGAGNRRLQPYHDPLAAPLSGLARKAIQAVLQGRT